MSKLKTHKAIVKRFGITKKGKILKRKAGQDHFNAREPGKITRKKRRDINIDKSYHRTIRRAMH